MWVGKKLRAATSCCFPSSFRIFQVRILPPESSGSKGPCLIQKIFIIRELPMHEHARSALECGGLRPPCALTRCQGGVKPPHSKALRAFIFRASGGSSRSRRKLRSGGRGNAQGDKTKALAEAGYHKEVRLIGKRRHRAEQHESAKADHRGIGEQAQLLDVRHLAGLSTSQSSPRRFDGSPGCPQEE